MNYQVLRSIALATAIALIYFAAAECGLSLASVHTNVSPVWSPTGIAIAAVLLTAYATENDRELALSAGFHMHLAKPVEPAELIAAVAQLAGEMRSA